MIIVIAIRRIIIMIIMIMIRTGRVGVEAEAAAARGGRGGRTGRPGKSSNSRPFRVRGRRPRTRESEGHTPRGDSGYLMLGERVALQPEVIRAIVLEDSPCCGVPHLEHAGDSHGGVRAHGGGHGVIGLGGGGLGQPVVHQALGEPKQEQSPGAVDKAVEGR